MPNPISANSTSTSAPPSRANRTRFLLLVADPDGEAAGGLVETLQGHQIDVVIVTGGADALLQVGMLLPDALLTAATVPPLGASTIVSAVQAYVGVPVIVGAGSDDAAEAVAALAAGASACVARPYRVAEILPILRSIRPGISADFEAPLQAGSLRLDPASMEVRFDGRTVRLPMREFQLLHLLMSHADKVLTREQIVRMLWHGDEHSNTLNVHVRRLRQRLGDDPQDPSIIVTVRGMGFRLIPPQSQRVPD